MDERILRLVVGYERSSKFLSALRTLPLWECEESSLSGSLLAPILKLAGKLKESADDRKVVRHLYAICSLIADGSMSVDERRAAIEQIARLHINSANPLRRAAALRVLGNLVQKSEESEARNTALIAAESVFRDVKSALAVPQKSSKKSRRIHAEACFVACSAMFVFERTLPESARHVSSGVDCMRSDETDLVRAACKFVLASLPFRARSAAAALHPLIDFFEKSLRQEVAPYVDWLRICAEISTRAGSSADAFEDFFALSSQPASNPKKENENEVPFEIADAFKARLVKAAFASSSAVWAEAVILLCRFPWKDLVAIGAPTSLSAAPLSSMLSALIERIQFGSIKAGCSPSASIICRAIEALGRSKCLNAQSQSNAAWGEASFVIDVDFSSIVAKLSKLLDAALQLPRNDFLLFRILSAAIWVCDPASDELLQTVGRGLKSLPDALAQSVLNSLSERVKCTPAMAPTFLRILIKEFESSPDVANVESILEAFSTCLSFGPAVGVSVVEAALDILDRAANIGENGEGAGVWAIASYYFLGEYAFQLDATYRRIVEERNAPSPEELPTLSELRPPLLRCVVMRLAKGMFLGSWEARRTCVESLLKCAIAHGEPCRIGVYKLFMAAKASPYCKELAIADKLTECVFFLDEVYKTLDAVSKGASPVDMNTMLIMKARYFCAVPNEFKFVR